MCVLLQEILLRYFLFLFSSSANFAFQELLIQFDCCAIVERVFFSSSSSSQYVLLAPFILNFISNGKQDYGLLHSSISFVFFLFGFLIFIFAFRSIFVHDVHGSVHLIRLHLCVKETFGGWQKPTVIICMCRTFRVCAWVEVTPIRWQWQPSPFAAFALFLVLFVCLFRHRQTVMRVTWKIYIQRMWRRSFELLAW